VLSEKVVIENLLQQKRRSVVSIVVMMCGVAGSGKTKCQRRNDYKQLIEEHGGVWELIYLKVEPDELRQRLLIRSERFDANAAFTITGDTLTRFLSGFETPVGEGETVIEA
jgi:hypothetical protein